MFSSFVSVFLRSLLINFVFVFPLEQQRQQVSQPRGDQDRDQSVKEEEERVGEEEDKVQEIPQTFMFGESFIPLNGLFSRIYRMK